MQQEDALAIAEHVDWMRSAGRSPRTIIERTRLLRRLGTWLTISRSVTLLSATEDDLAAWQRSLACRPAETVNTYLGHARGFYRWLARFRHAPDAGALLTRPQRPRGLPRPIGEDELRLALRTADGPILIALLLMAFCGLRVGEVAGLHRRDIHERTTPPVVVVTGKGRRMRVVRLPDGLARQLLVAGLPNSGPVVRGERGQPVTANRLSQLVNAHLHEQGVADTAHSLRHYFGTTAYRLTRDLRLVQESMGHASPETTAIYTAWSPPAAADMAAGLDAAMREMLDRPGLRSVGSG